jgi:uncharacterized repeat protein (TIGR03803 family)
VNTSDRSFRKLHSFSFPDGAWPQGGVVLDSAGNLYGVTAMGGNGGTVFTVHSDGTGYQVLHGFSGSDGQSPYATLFMDSAGKLYGTTVWGGSDGYGTVFALTTSSDTTAPVITPNVTGTFNNGWYTGNASVAWTVSDDESAITAKTGCDPATVDGDTTDATFTCTATSAGGTNSQSVTIKRDATAPAISIASPAATSYFLNQAAAANYSCMDAVSGVASCVGTVANGANINTTAAGAKAFAVNAADNAGNTSSATVAYMVNYGFSGFLAPVNNAPVVNTGKAGRTYPVKWQLRDANGNFISALTAVGSVTYQAAACGSFAGAPTDPLEASTTGASGLRYDSTANQYLFNWSSPGAAGCYTLFLRLDSGQVFPAYFSLN